MLATDGTKLTLTGRSAPLATPLATAPAGGDVRGLAFDASGGHAWASSTGDHRTTRLTIRTGGRTVTADLSG